MDIKNIILAVVGMVLAAVMIGGALLPSVVGAVDSSATPVTFENLNNSFSPYRYDYVDKMELTINVTSDNVTITVNGMTLEPSTANYTLFASSNGFSEVFPESSGNVTRFFYWNDELDGVDSYTVSRSNVGTSTAIIDNGIYTITTYNGDVIESISKWVACPVIDGSFIAHHGNFNECYFTSIDEMIVYSGNYINGENDTFVSYGLGEITTSDAWAGLVNIDYVGGSLVDDTKDIYYGGNIVISVDDESFTPYRTLIKAEVIGKSTNNIVQNMLQILPIVAVAGLVMAGIYVFISHK